MSTNAQILIRTSDNKYRGVTLHWDGYPAHVLPLLVHHYNTPEKAKALVDGGNLSTLAETVEECVYYKRDRGETGQEARVYASFDDTLLVEVEYRYLRIEGEWKFYGDEEGVDSQD